MEFWELHGKQQLTSNMITKKEFLGRAQKLKVSKKETLSLHFYLKIAWYLEEQRAGTSICFYSMTDIACSITDCYDHSSSYQLPLT